MALFNHRRRLARLAWGAALALAVAGAARSGPDASGVAPLTVDGQRQPAAPLLTQPVAATAQTITVIPAEVIELSAVTELRDVLRFDPSVSAHADEDSGQGDNVQIRGFSARFDVYRDGQLDLGQYYRDPFDLAAVEVLTGPSSVAFGRGSTGGVIDDIAKAPTPQALDAAALSFGTDHLARLTADVDAPLGPGAAFRINGMGTTTGVAGRDVARYRRAAVSPALALGLGGATELSLSWLHQTQWDRPDYGVPWIDIGVPGRDVSHPAAVPWHDFYGFKDDYSHTDADVGTARLTHDLGGGWTLTNQLRAAAYARSYRIAEPTIAPIVAPGTPLAALAVARTERGGHSSESLVEDDLDATGEVSTFGVTHTLVVGAALGRQTSDPTTLSFSGVPGTRLVDPDEDQAFSGVAKPKTVVRFSADTAAAYAGDTAQLAPAWQLDLGARVDRFAARFSNAVPAPAAFDHTDVAATWRAALVWRPAPSVHAYLMAGTSFDPSAEGLSLSASTADLAPETTRTLETGVKWQAAPALLVTGALFRTTMFNAREPSPTDPTLQILAGTERVQGLELAAQGRVTARWLVLGGYTFLDARVVASPDDDSGQPLQDAPRHNLRLFTAYDVGGRWTVGGGLGYQSSRVPASVPDANGFRQQVPGYWTASALLRYRLGPHLQLQLNADNLFDAHYYDGLDDNHVNVGAGRSIHLTIAAER
ncbi:MAG TPA: TonB-dependent siderophore receptor [Caulobacteraceae bacterium]